jgi:osmoprotectant transport system substrate-binding protein
MRKLRLTSVAAATVVVALAVTGCGGDDSGSSSASTSTSSTASNGSSGSGSASTAAAAATFNFKPLDAGGPITKAALKNGDIQIAELFSSDADIAANNWVALDDDKHLQQLENLIPAIRVDKTTDQITKALNAVSAKLTTDELVEMNRQNSVEDKSPKDVAAAWLKDKDLVPYTGDKASGDLTIGSTNFAEQEIVAELYAQVLESAGVKVERKFQLGSREVVAPALENGQIDLYPEYVGTYTLFVDKNATVPSDIDKAVDQLRQLLAPKKLTVLDPADAQDTNTFVVTKATADKYNLSSVSDLAKVPDKLTLGGPPECPQRPFCLIGLKDTYGLKFNI